ncbi:hypothetical protein IPO96_05135 [Candidatus Saccharibacteria bacterium]|nr:MAG: hypothetical protein IPO96_05135 [Candidatus Saccharibacteria bacterium]
MNSSKISLSRYLPKNSYYYYGYPSGQNDDFLNLVPPEVEELVAARALVCAGEDVKVLCFKQAYEACQSEIYNIFGTKNIYSENVVLFPSQIDVGLFGDKRNAAVKEFLKTNLQNKELLMAQPFTNDEMKGLFLIDPSLTNWLNDKRNIPEFIPSEYHTKRLAMYKNGRDFLRNIPNDIDACVVKVSSSSAGDGVYLCKSKSRLADVANELSNSTSNILIEEYVDAVRNYGIQFAIDYNNSSKIEIIGISNQVTTTKGEFIGGLILNNEDSSDLDGVIQCIKDIILPGVAKLGWYGVGCFDVLVDRSGRSYIIDCNFRMTGMTAYLMLKANGIIAKNVATFNGLFAEGSEKLTQKLMMLKETMGEEFLHILALTVNDGICRMNAAILFDDINSMKNIAKLFLGIGIQSKALKKYASYNAID